MTRQDLYNPFDQAFISDFLGQREVLSVALLTKGKRNINYRLELSDGQTCILRQYTNGNAQREAYLLKLVGELLPVPRELYRGESWAIFSFLEGEHLGDFPQHSRAAADAITKISSLVFEIPGTIMPDGSVSAFPFTGTNAFVANILSSTDLLRQLGQARVDTILEVFHKNEDLFVELDSESCLVHGDFNPSNILINKGEVSGVVDWEFSHSGTPYMDIGNLLRNTNPMFHPDIKSGLEAGGREVPDDWKERAELVDLSNQLELLSATQTEKTKQACIDRIDGFIAKFSRY